MNTKHQRYITIRTGDTGTYEVIKRAAKRDKRSVSSFCLVATLEKITKMAVDHLGSQEGE
jgi:uncharacterized protein (DUF1778 family)